MKKEEKRPVYVLCPRCELNYIEKKDKLCNVCKAELGLVDKSILIPDDEELEVERLCPVCHVNYLAEDEDICFLCQKAKEEKEPIESEVDSWKEFVDDEEKVPEEEIEISLDLVAEDEEEEEIEAGEPVFKEPDDFEFDVNPDDFIEDDEEEDLDDDEL